MNIRFDINRSVRLRQHLRLNLWSKDPLDFVLHKITVGPSKVEE